MIHAVFHGRPLCGFTSVPVKDWSSDQIGLTVQQGQTIHIDPEQVKRFCPTCLHLVCGPEVLTIHVLDPNTHEPVCGFQRGNFWRKGHTGVSVTDQSKNPNCPSCLTKLKGPNKTAWDWVMADEQEEIDTITAEGYMLKAGIDPYEARQRYEKSKRKKV